MSLGREGGGERGERGRGGGGERGERGRGGGREEGRGERGGEGEGGRRGERREGERGRGIIDYHSVCKQTEGIILQVISWTYRSQGRDYNSQPANSHAWLDTRVDLPHSVYIRITPHTTLSNGGHFHV